uniref:Secreted protein n=1 Tax=Syphacia muris TaxID=451379 RepID=A0A0N5AJ98_9BILA
MKDRQCASNRFRAFLSLSLRIFIVARCFLPVYEKPEALEASAKGKKLSESKVAEGNNTSEEFKVNVDKKCWRKELRIW